MRNTARLLVLAMIAGPTFSPAGQKKDDIVSMQRDIADLADKLSKLQKSQDEGMKAITALVQQSMDSSSKVSGSLSVLQTSLTTSLNASLAEQQNKLNAQHADTNAKLDTLTQTVGAANETVGQLSGRLKDMDSKLKDLLELVKTLNAPPSAPVPVAPANAATGAPAGWSAISAYSNARNDYSGGKYKLALDEFAEYLKYAPKDDENAPNAQYYIGQIYDQNGQYEDSARAFGDVVDRFPKNAKTCESSYMKGLELQKAKLKEDAYGAFKEFLSACPGDINRESAVTHMHEVSPAPRGANTKSKGKSK